MTFSYNLDPVSQYNTAMAGKLDVWVPAAGGTEPVTEFQGWRVQYCFNPATGEHAYYDLNNDLILEYEQLPSWLRG